MLGSIGFRNVVGFLTILAVSLVGLVPEAYARDYQSGHQALEVFDAAAMEAMPGWMTVWIASSTLCFAAGLGFVWRHRVARWVVGGWAAALSVLVVSSGFDSDLFRLAGFNALAHVVFWTPALCQLLSHRPFLAKEPSPFSIWSAVITAIMLFSYVFDIPYALTYLGHVLGDL